MSVSEHPIALRLEQRVGGATKLLATVMALPLLDGIFPALVIAGVLASPFGIIETGLLIFGGSATMAVILAEMDGSPREQAVSILLIGAIIVPVAAVQAALAMTLDSVLNLEIFKRFAGLVILAIAAKTASSEIGEYLPSPAVIILLGLVASLSPNGASLQVANDPYIVAAGAAAAGVGVAFALGVALFGPHLRGRVDIDRFRFGSAVALGVLALPILGVLETDAPIALAVLAVTGLLAYNPDADHAGVGAGAGAGHGHDDDDEDGSSPDDEGSDAEDGLSEGASGDGDDAPSVDDSSAPGNDGRDSGPVPGVTAAGSDEADEEKPAYGYPGEEADRAPWL